MDNQITTETQMYVVVWRHREDPYYHGRRQEPMSYSTAQAWADELNREWPMINHWVEAA